MPQILSRCEVDIALLPHLKGWTCQPRAISKEFECRDDQQAKAFAEAVREKAEEMELCPDIIFHDASRVKLVLSSQEVGGLTDNDIRLAREIETFAPVQ